MRAMVMSCLCVAMFACVTFGQATELPDPKEPEPALPVDSPLTRAMARAAELKAAAWVIGVHDAPFVDALADFYFRGVGDAKVDERYVRPWVLAFCRDTFDLNRDAFATNPPTAPIDVRDVLTDEGAALFCVHLDEMLCQSQGAEYRADVEWLNAWLTGCDDVARAEKPESCWEPPMGPWQTRSSCVQACGQAGLDCTNCCWGGFDADPVNFNLEACLLNCGDEFGYCIESCPAPEPWQ